MRPLGGRAAHAGGALVIVGGHSRGVGKTLTIEHLLRAREGERWVGVKVSAHRHARAGAAPLIEEDAAPSRETQTGRYLLAGASRAFLVRAPDAHLAAAAQLVGRLQADGWNVAVESNRLVEWVAADRVIFAVAPDIDDWKPSSSRAIARADALATLATFRPAASFHVRAPARLRLFRLGDAADDKRFADWLREAFNRGSRRSWPARMDVCDSALLA